MQRETCQQDEEPSVGNEIACRGRKEGKPKKGKSDWTKIASVRIGGVSLPRE